MATPEKGNSEVSWKEIGDGGGAGDTNGCQGCANWGPDVPVTC